MKPWIKTSPTYEFKIFIAGNYNTAVTICREYCDDVSFCVTVTPTKYVYKGGEEEGIIVGIINYPRFSKTPDVLFSHAQNLAYKLKDELKQESFSIQGPQDTVWHSWRKEDT